MGMGMVCDWDGADVRVVGRDGEERGEGSDPVVAGDAPCGTMTHAGMAMMLNWDRVGAGDVPHCRQRAAAGIHASSARTHSISFYSSSVLCFGDAISYIMFHCHHVPYHCRRHHHGIMYHVASCLYSFPFPYLLTLFLLLFLSFLPLSPARCDV